MFSGVHSGQHHIFLFKCFYFIWVVHLKNKLIWFDSYFNLLPFCRIHWCRQKAACLGRSLWRHQEQEAPDMAEDPRTDYGKVPDFMCGATQEPHSQGGSLPVQEHLPAGRLLFKLNTYLVATILAFSYFSQRNPALCVSSGPGKRIHISRRAYFFFIPSRNALRHFTDRPFAHLHDHVFVKAPASIRWFMHAMERIQML